MFDDVLNVMKDIARDSSMGMIVVTHEMGFAREVGDRVIFMADGEILEDDTKEQFFDGEPSNERARQFLSKIIVHK